MNAAAKKIENSKIITEINSLKKSLLNQKMMGSANCGVTDHVYS